VTGWTFTVPGEIRGKGRPRFSTRGGFARAYTDAATENMEAWFKACATGSGIPVLEGPVRVEMHIFVTPPASWPKKKREAALAGHVRPTTKPDLDNCVKLLDSLNGIAWQDDKQIVELLAAKSYGAQAYALVRIAPVFQRQTDERVAA
jgi:Holliday junction resolvase RusA-like endonuclease